MNCSEFREMSEAYLSDELLVETNIQVFRHLESCAKCRSDFNVRKKLRGQMRDAVLNSERFVLDPAFATRLSADLREQAGRKKWFEAWFSPVRLAPAAALLFVLFLAGAYFVGPILFSGSAGLHASVLRSLTEASLKAVGNHEDCAVEKMSIWVSGSVPVPDKNQALAAEVVRPLSERIDNGIKVIHSHDCAFEGRVFSHVILDKNGHTISVFFDRTQNPDLSGVESGAIVSEIENGLQVAIFARQNRAVFVISDLPESENVAVARALSASFVRQDAV